MRADDAVVEANRDLLLKRSQVGILKYGVTLAGSNLGRRALLQHALEEALDLANYLQAELQRDPMEKPKWHTKAPMRCAALAALCAPIILTIALRSAATASDRSNLKRLRS